MPDLVQRALTAKRESKYIEFKENFDPDSPADWCEVIKDIVAIANSGGGVMSSGWTVRAHQPDHHWRGSPKLTQLTSGTRFEYTGPVHLEFEIQEVKKKSKNLHACSYRQCQFRLSSKSQERTT